MDELAASYQELVHLARLALSGRRQDIQLYMRKLMKRTEGVSPAIARQIADLLRESPVPQSPFRAVSADPIPVDHDTKLSLVRCEFPVQLEVDPIWPQEVLSVLEQLINEQKKVTELESRGLVPTRTALLLGRPGVGKTLAARWIAQSLNRPLLTLDLAAVMSSFLGRTGNNLRYVLDYAKGTPCVLLLDELDAVAKKRDDDVEVGELKRLVTVLLQEIDDWPATGLLIAATNHPDLLDPAVWRRFEVILEMPLPRDEHIAKIIDSHLQNAGESVRSVWRSLLARAFLLNELSFSDVQRELTRARREAAINKSGLDDSLANLVRKWCDRVPRRDRGQMAAALVKEGFSQRQVHELTGVSRDTIRKSDGARARRLPT